MSSKPPPSKRTTSSTTPVPSVKPQCKIHSLAVIAERAQLTGPHHITIGEDSIIHPHAQIKAEHGNVTIGKNCIVAEKAIVGPGFDGDADCALGDGVSVETGAVVECRKVGDHTTIGVKAKVGTGAVVGRWCKIAPLCEVREDKVLDDFTVVFGYGQRRVETVLRDQEDVRQTKAKGRRKEVELLKTLVPDAGAKWRG